jgi:hypothetical protein
VEQYSLALEVGDDTRGAVAAARDGLAQAFGEGCGLP